MNTAISKPEPVVAGEPFADYLREKNRDIDAQRITERSLIRMGTRYAACSLRNFLTPTKAQQEVAGHLQDYARILKQNTGKGINILLHGPPGTGKDHLLAAMVREAYARSIGVEWTDGADLYGAMRDRMGNDEAEQQFLRRYTTPDVLAISDPLPPMGAVTDFQRILLFRLIDRRYRDLRPVWMTLNVASREEAEQRLSPNICDRLGESALRLTCNWPSYRGRGKEGGVSLA